MRDAGSPLVGIGNELYACAACSAQFLRRDAATSADEGLYLRLATAVPTVVVEIERCPTCGSTDAGPDPARSMFESTYVRCGACGFGGYYDNWDRGDWRVFHPLVVGVKRLPPYVTPLAPGAGFHDDGPAPAPAAATRRGG